MQNQSGYRYTIFSISRSLSVSLIKLLLSSLLLLSWQQAQAEKPPIAVIGYQVKEVSVNQQLNALGSLQAQQSTQLAFGASDILQKIHVRSGQTVKQGELLFELNHSEQLAQLEQARAIEKEAQNQYNRVKKGLSRTTVTQAQLDERYRQWQTAIAQRKIYQQQISDRKLYAPFDGQIGLINLAIGKVVNSGDPLTTLDQLATMKMNFLVPADYLAELSVGQSVEISTSAYAEQLFQGQINAISAQLEAQSRMIQVQALVDNPQKLLKTNMLVEALINLKQKQQLQVPNSALLMLGDKVFIYRLKAQDNNLYKAEKVQVKVGDIGPVYSEILSGINVGDIVVSQGVMRVNSKAKISLKGLQNNASQAELLKPGR